MMIALYLGQFLFQFTFAAIVFAVTRFYHLRYNKLDQRCEFLVKLRLCVQFPFYALSLIPLWFGYMLYSERLAHLNADAVRDYVGTIQLVLATALALWVQTTIDARVRELKRALSVRHVEAKYRLPYADTIAFLEAQAIDVFPLEAFEEDIGASDAARIHAVVEDTVLLERAAKRMEEWREATTRATECRSVMKRYLDGGKWVDCSTARKTRAMHAWNTDALDRLAAADEKK